MTRGHRIVLLATLIGLVAAAVVAAGLAGPAAAQEVDDLQRSSDTFSYYQLGHHVPPRSGNRGYNDAYLGARTVIDQNLGLPMEIDPLSGEHMYCNTQVWGFRDNGAPAGKTNHIKNYPVPWTSTFCEVRWTTIQPTRACGPNSPQSHQGIDCRPPKPLADTYWMTAVEDGKVRRARRNLVEVIGTNSSIRWKYRHGAAPVVAAGDTVRKGDRLALIADLRSTPIHLHLEAERPAGTDIDPMAAIIVATLRAMGEEPSIVDGELAFDPRYEIPADAPASVCSDEAAADPLGTDRDFAFQQLWCHNRSIMGFARSGETVRLVYHRPRSAGLADSVRRAPVLVEGVIVDGDFRGVARHYSTACGDQTFDVEGAWATGATSLVLIGERRQFDRECGFRLKAETLTFSFLRELNPDAPPADPERKSLTEVTRNWGAITMPMADPDRWLSYVRNWPGLVLGAELTDSAGGVIPAFVTDEAGIGLWWYWLSIRKGFGETGRPTFLAIARGIAGPEALPAVVRRYVDQYLGLAPRYFGRDLAPDEPIDLTDHPERYALGLTMFHHESGRTPMFDEATFVRGIRFGSDVINDRFRTVEHYTRDAPGDDGPADGPVDLAARLERVESENQELLSMVEELRGKLENIREIVAD